MKSNQVKTIRLSLARSWMYHSHIPVDKEIKLDRIYFFQGGSAYFHHPAINVRIGYKNKVFLLLREQREIKISIYPRSLTNKKIIEWFKTWANNQDKIVTPGGVIIPVNEITIRESQNTTKQTEFIYFILNSDSNAVKIGIAKNVSKRQQSLQVANPVKLILLKAIEVQPGKEAKDKEHFLHQKFKHLRIIGEWFQYNLELQ